jgi:hypothetical protein
VNQRIVYRYVDMAAVVSFALETLKANSPVGSGDDKHPGLYRDSHLVFIDGHVVKDVSGWRPGQQINISNPVPYSRKLEGGPGRPPISLPGHVYELSEPIISARYGNSVSIKFVFMPVRFGSVQDYAHSLTGQAAGSRRGGSKKALRDWLVRQPALQITAR